MWSIVTLYFPSWGPPLLTIPHHNSNSYPNFKKTHKICCTWHDSCAVVSCAEIWYDITARYKIIAKDIPVKFELRWKNLWWNWPLAQVPSLSEGRRKTHLPVCNYCHETYKDRCCIVCKGQVWLMDACFYHIDINIFLVCIITVTS